MVACHHVKYIRIIYNLIINPFTAMISLENGQ